MFSAAAVAAFLAFSTAPQASALRAPDVAQPWQPSDGVLIFTEGKVGSTTLTNSFMGVMGCQIGYNNNKSMRGLKCHTPECAKSFLMRQPAGSRTWVVSAVRDPFSQMPSYFFQNKFNQRFTPDQLAGMPMADLMREFHKFLPKYPPHWFELNFLRGLGIDVTSHPFDFQKGLLHFSQKWEGKNIDVIVVRVEDVQRWGEILKPFFPTFKSGHANSAAKRGQAFLDLYDSFLDMFKYTKEEIEVLSAGEGLRHFYNESEAGAFVAREMARHPLRSRSRVQHESGMDVFDEGDSEGGPSC